MANGMHGKSGSSIYAVWSNIIQRCTNPNLAQFDYYGGRGISVCDRWKSSFECFLEDVGDVPFVGAQLDRIDNNGNYEPSNVRWVTASENIRNRRPVSEWRKPTDTRRKSDSTTFSIRLPNSMVETLRQLAESDRRSVNSTINMLLEHGLSVAETRGLVS